MKKSRNTFFQESNYQSYNPNMNMGAAPFQQASNFFYQGPLPQNNYNTMDNTMDIESRIAKIERQINRMDYRISKLENATNILSSDDFDTTKNNTNMYML